MKKLIPLILILAFGTQVFADAVEKMAFVYKDTDFRVVAEFLGKKMNKTFVIDPGCRGKVNIIPSGPLTLDEAYSAFLIGLAMNGLTILEDGKFTKILQAQNSQRSNLEVFTELPDDHHERMMTYIYKTKYLSAKDLYNVLGPILQSRLGEMRPFEDHMLIASDYLSNLHRLQKIYETVDVPKK